MTRFSRCSIFALIPLIPVACATAEQNGPDGAGTGASSSNAGQTSAGASGSGNMSGTSSVGGIAAGGTSSMGGAGAGTSGATVGGAGSSNSGGMGGSSSGTGGVASGGAGNGGGGTAGNQSGGAGAGGKGGTGGGGAGGNQSGGAGSGGGGAGSGGGGNGGSGGNNMTAYCDAHAKSALPYTVNEGFQPSVYEGDTLAISRPTAAPDPCATRVANAVGDCSTWRYTPNAVTPTWAGVVWSTKWDAMYTHAPVCLADGATKVTFWARGAIGGEQVTFSAAGSAEVPMTLTNAWKQYSISLVGVMYNTTVDGVESGFFWKADPNVGTITFFIDDIQIEK